MADSMFQPNVTEYVFLVTCQALFV